MSRILFVLAGIGLCVAGSLQAQPPRGDGLSTAASSSNLGGISAISSTASLVSDLAVEGQDELASLHAQVRRRSLELQWGVMTMELPGYLRHEGLGLGPDQGILVTRVIPGTPAAVAGLRQGELIIEVDGVPTGGCHGLPGLGEAPRQLLGASNEGLREIQVSIDMGLPNMGLGWAPELAWMTEADAMAGEALGGFSMPQVPGWLGSQVQSPVRSLAVSEANGRMSVSAIVACGGGEKRVELRGSRAEIVQQLQTLPLEVQQALAVQLGL